MRRVSEAELTKLIAKAAMEAVRQVKVTISNQIASLTAAVAAGYQPLDATLVALAALDATSGLLEQTGADTFSRRALGVAAGTSIPTRADADTRFAAASHTHMIADVTSLQATLDARALKASPVLSLSASQTPTTNGELVLQLTSDTTLTIKVKGSDGTVRHVDLTLTV